MKKPSEIRELKAGIIGTGFIGPVHIEALRREISTMMNVPVHIGVEEIRKPELDAQLVAEGIAQQLERRVMFRRAMKRAVQNALKAGAQGIRVVRVLAAERLDRIDQFDSPVVVTNERHAQTVQAQLDELVQRVDLVPNSLALATVSDSMRATASCTPSWPLPRTAISPAS